jgi:hypothetical protein
MADRCKATLQNHALDKKHTLSTYKLDDIDAYNRVPDEYVSLAEGTYKLPVSSLPSIDLLVG